MIESIQIRTAITDFGACASIADLLIFIDQYADNINGENRLHPQSKRIATETLKNIKTTLQNIERDS